MHFRFFDFLRKEVPAAAQTQTHVQSGELHTAFMSDFSEEGPEPSDQEHSVRGDDDQEEEPLTTLAYLI